MEDDGIKMDPHYTADDLEIITVNELRDRISQLKTARAQQVAHELWRRMEEVFTTSPPGSRSFLRSDATMHELAGPIGRGLLLEMLRKLRTVGFKRLLDSMTRADDPQDLPPGLARRQGGRGKKHINLEMASRMHQQLESIMYGGRQMPFLAQRNWVCLIIFLLIGAAIYLQREWLLDQFVAGIWRPPLMLVMLGFAYGIWYRLTFWVQDKMRILALYIAFTDSFTELEL